MYNTSSKKFPAYKFKIYLVMLLLEAVDTVKIERYINLNKINNKNNYIIKENLHGK